MPRKQVNGCGSNNLTQCNNTCKCRYLRWPHCTPSLTVFITNMASTTLITRPKPESTCSDNQKLQNLLKCRSRMVLAMFHGKTPYKCTVNCVAFWIRFVAIGIL